ncbi:MAG: MtnX-like HAD-IB family phosphatase [Ignavibacteria bacterium]|nr:MtnX-like HAD-IB family phosphatase [Ignavibacteria bacterium]
MNRREFKIFLDFDGTISQLDVGEALFRKFGDEKMINKIIGDLLNDKISSKQSWIELCNSVLSIAKVELHNFLDTMLIESSFHSFKEYCRVQNFEIYVLSDGFDYYIERVLKNNSVDGLVVYSNHLEIIDGKLHPSFPHYDDSGFSSANCKKNHIINHSSDDDYTVFIGDGNSDKETVEYCDFIFAKDDLLKYCEKERITFFPFKNFDDVIKKLNELKEKKRLKKRNRAVLKRKQAYLIE